MREASLQQLVPMSVMLQRLEMMESMAGRTAFCTGGRSPSLHAPGYHRPDNFKKRVVGEEVVMEEE